MTRADMIQRLGALRAHIDRELGTLLAALERPRGKSGRDVPLDCDVCGVEDWRRCTCDPNSPANARLLRSSGQ